MIESENTQTGTNLTIVTILTINLPFVWAVFVPLQKAYQEERIQSIGQAAEVAHQIIFMKKKKAKHLEGGA